MPWQTILQYVNNALTRHKNALHVLCVQVLLTLEVWK